MASASRSGCGRRKLLKWMVHSLEIFMWKQDYFGGSFSGDVDLDYLDDDFEDDELGDFDLESFVDSISLPVEPTDEIPTWSVHAEYPNHTRQDITSYDETLPDRPEQLYGFQLEYFQTEW